MDAVRLQQWIDRVKRGTLLRRGLIERMAGVGLAAPLANQMLAVSGMAMPTSSGIEYTPNKRGGGGTLKLLRWEGPTLLNPHFCQRDQGPKRLAPVLRAARGMDAVWHAEAGPARTNPRDRSKPDQPARRLPVRGALHLRDRCLRRRRTLAERWSNTLARALP